MKLTVVNFADNSFQKQQKWNSLTAKIFGRASNVISFSPDDIQDYLNDYPQFQKYKKGFGNYFWKPYIIQKALQGIEENDFLFYADSGSIILKDLRILCRELIRTKKDVMVFQLPLIEKQWTKRDCLILMNADNPAITETPQILSGFILMRKSINTLKFIKHYRLACLDERIISEDDNVLGVKNHHGFIEHRHDQSVLSVLAKKNDFVQIERDISDYGIFPKSYLVDKKRLFDYNAMNPMNYNFKGFVVSNRKADPLVYLIKYFIKRIVRK